MSPNSKTGSPLGPLERRVMEALWAQAPAAPGEVLATLNAADAPGLAYTTVTTILVRLTEKGYVERQADGRRFAYGPLVGPEELDQIAGRRALDRLLRRYGAGNIARFAADLRPEDEELASRLRALADTDQQA